MDRDEERTDVPPRRARAPRDPKLERIRELGQQRDAVEAELRDAIADARTLDRDEPWPLQRVRAWHEIGKQLGVTAEAVRKRYRHVDPKVRAREGRR